MSGRLAWVDDDELFVVGGREGVGWIGAIDPCAGELAGETDVSPTGATSSRLISIAARGSDLFVIGSMVSESDPGNGVFARVARSSLEVLWSGPLVGSEGVDEGWDIVSVPSDGLWMAGVADVGGTPAPWGIKGDMQGAACGFAASSSSGLSRALAAAGQNVYMASTVDAALRILRFDAAGCSVASPCPCEPQWSSADIRVGSHYTEVHRLAAPGTTGYAVGFASDSGAPEDRYAFVAAVDLTSGAVTGTYRFDPTTLTDAFAAVALDGEHLYVGGVQGWDGQESLAGATGVVHALPLPLTDATTPAWTAAPVADGAIIGLSRGESDGLYASARAGTDGAVLRCTAAGVCP